MTVTNLPTLLGRDEAAKVLHMHPVTLLRKAREKKIGSVRSGNRVLFTTEQIHEYLTNGETKAARPSRDPKYGRRSK